MNPSSAFRSRPPLRRRFEEDVREHEAVDRADPAADETVQMRPDPVDRTVTDHVAGGAGPVEHLAAFRVALGPGTVAKADAG
jgi:hypothetical protein